MHVGSASFVGCRNHRVYSHKLRARYRSCSQKLGRYFNNILCVSKLQFRLIHILAHIAIHALQYNKSYKYLHVLMYRSFDAHSDESTAPKSGTSKIIREQCAERKLPEEICFSVSKAYFRLFSNEPFLESEPALYRFTSIVLDIILMQGATYDTREDIKSYVLEIFRQLRKEHGRSLPKIISDVFSVSVHDELVNSCMKLRSRQDFPELVCHKIGSLHDDEYRGVDIFSEPVIDHFVHDIIMLLRGLPDDPASVSHGR